MTQYTFTKDQAEELLGEDIANDVWDEMRTIAETESALEALEKSDDDVLGSLPNDSVSLDDFFARLTAIIDKLNTDTRAAGHALEAHARRVQDPAALFIVQAREFLDRVANQPLTPEGIQKMRDGHLLLDDPGTPGSTGGEDLRKSKGKGGDAPVRFSPIDTSKKVTADERAALDQAVAKELDRVYGKVQPVPQFGSEDYEPLAKDLLADDARALGEALDAADLAGAPAAVRSAAKSLRNYLDQVARGKQPYGYGEK